MRNDLLIDEILPEEFPTLLGLYVATCGHIEAAAFRIILHVQGVDPGDEDQVAEFAKIRRSTDDLVNLLRKVAARMPEEERGWALHVVEQIDGEARFPRNMAIHGAWRRAPDGRDLTVDYYRPEGDRKGAPLRPYRDPIPVDEVVFAVRHVDRILRLLVWIETRLAGR